MLLWVVHVLGAILPALPQQWENLLFVLVAQCRSPSLCLLHHLLRGLDEWEEAKSKVLTARVTSSVTPWGICLLSACSAPGKVLAFQSQALTSNEKGKLSVCSFTDTLIWHPLPPSRAVPVPSCLLLFLPLCFTAVAWSSLHGTQSWSKVTVCSLPLYRLHSLLR